LVSFFLSKSEFIKTVCFVDKPAKLSSVLANFEAGLAVDGIYEAVFSSLVHSNEENRPWWRVDLRDVYCVWAVNILNRHTSE